MYKEKYVLSYNLHEIMDFVAKGSTFRTIMLVYLSGLIHGQKICVIAEPGFV